MNTGVPKTARADSGFDGEDPDIIRGAINNDMAEVQAALKKDPADINKTHPNYGMTALHYAAGLGNASMVSFLLDQDGVNVLYRDRWGRDPLDVAINSGKPECIDSLFKFRAHAPSV